MMVNEQGMSESLYQIPSGNARLTSGYGKNIDLELKNIFSPIRASHSPYSNASSASYGTPEHSSGYYEPRNVSSHAYFNPSENGQYSRASEALMARPNSSGPSVFMKEFSRDHRYNFVDNSTKL